MKTFPEFANYCIYEDIELDSRLMWAGEKRTSSLTTSLEPDGYFSAIAEAGVLLRCGQPPRLTDKPIPPCAPTAGSHPAEHMLRAIVNASLEPPMRPGDNGTVFSVPARVEELQVCGDAENYFSYVTRQMESPADPAWYGSFIGYQIFASPQGRAIAIRKTEGVASTLTLEKMTINGIPYPAGSLMRASTLTAKRGKEGEQSRLSTDDITSIGFLRISALALPIADRASFIGCLQGCIDPDSKDTLQRYSIVNVRQAAQNALAHDNIKPINATATV